MVLLVPDNILLVLGQHADVLEAVFTMLDSSQEGAFAEGFTVFLETSGVDKRIGVSKNFLIAHARKRVTEQGRDARLSR